ncbi:MAG: DUF935 family protein [Capsulimonadales bacterium]|nr:DUF935 family protein [Capsulimonadales bacterium]
MGTEAVTRAFSAEYGPADGYPPGGPETFERMRRDPQVRACLTTKTLSVLSEDVEVHPADESDAARRAARRTEEQLARLPGGIPGLCAGALEALALGCAIGELIRTDDGELGEVRWHDPRRFRFLTDDFGAIRELEVIDADLRLPRSRFVLYSYQSRFGNPYGESDLIAAYRPWAAKDLVQRMWLSALDRFGAPIPVAKVPTSWSQAETDALTALLARLQNESALVVTADVDIGVTLDAGRVEPARAFHVAAEWLDTQIARAILGQELTTQSGKAGSYALGKVHQEILSVRIRTIRRELAAMLTDQIARPITETGFGSGVPVPVLRFPNLTTDELAARQALMLAMIDGNVVAPDEAWIRRYLGLPARSTEGGGNDTR